MAPLHNKYDKKELRENLMASGEEFVTLSFYKYHKILNVPLFRDHLYTEWEKMGVLGRIYVASEGINAQLAVPNARWKYFQDHIGDITFLEQVHLNVAIEQTPSFFKLTIKAKDKILADGLNDFSFDPGKSGDHLDAQSFNELCSKDDTILIDMRNHYEHEVGHFDGAVTPDVDTFRASLPIIEEMFEGDKEKDVVMYCTGGIRCEKASAWFKHRGFKSVYQLKGGIIEYARQVKEQNLDNKFIGKNFVFDERLGERITEDVIAQCHQCGASSDRHTNCEQEGCHLLFIQCEDCAKKMQGCCSTDCLEIHQLPEEEQKEIRAKLGKNKDNIYRKGRSDKLPFKK